MNELDLMLESKKTPEEREQEIVDKSNEQTKKFLRKHKKDLPEEMVKKIEKLSKTRMPSAWISYAIGTICSCVFYKGESTINNAKFDTSMKTIASLGRANPDRADILVDGDTKEGKQILFYTKATIPSYVLALSAFVLSMFLISPKKYKKHIDKYTKNIKKAISIETDPERKKKYQKMLKMVGTVDSKGKPHRSKAEMDSLKKYTDKISGTVSSVITSKFNELKTSKGFEDSSISVKPIKPSSVNKDLKDISVSSIPVATIEITNLEKPASVSKFTKFANAEILPVLNTKMPKGVTIKKISTNISGITQVIASFDLDIIMESVDFYRSYHEMILE